MRFSSAPSISKQLAGKLRAIPILLRRKSEMTSGGQSPVA